MHCLFRHLTQNKRNLQESISRENRARHRTPNSKQACHGQYLHGQAILTFFKLPFNWQLSMGYRCMYLPNHIKPAQITSNQYQSSPVITHYIQLPPISPNQP